MERYNSVLVVIVVAVIGVFALKLVSDRAAVDVDLPAVVAHRAAASASISGGADHPVSSPKAHKPSGDERLSAGSTAVESAPADRPADSAASARSAQVAGGSGSPSAHSIGHSASLPHEGLASAARVAG